MHKGLICALAAIAFLALGMGVASPLDRLVAPYFARTAWLGAGLLSHLGDTFAYVLAGLWFSRLYRKEPGDLVSFLLLLAGQHILMESTKSFFHTIRPVLPNQVGGYAFPSGHTLMAVCLYGYLAARTQRKMLWILPILVGWSRMALGTHWLSDVLGAGLLGWLWLQVCEHFSRRARQENEEGSHS